MDQRLHLRLHLLAVGQNDLRRVGDDASFRQPIERLQADAHALAHLLHAEDVASPDVAVVRDGHVELELLVTRVGHVTADVEVDAGSAQRRAGYTERDGIGGGKIADALEARDPDGVVLQQAFVLFDLRREALEERANLAVKVRRWFQRNAADAIALGVTGPPLRASGVDFDVRRDMPYSGYEKFQFNVPVSNDCDVWARYILRMQEMRESVKICLQALDGLPEGRIVADAPKIILPDREQMKTQMESLIHHFKIVTEGFQVPAGEVCSSVEAPHGMMNYYVVSDGTAKPYRVHMRNPDFATLQALETMCKGKLIADVVAIIGSIDIVLGAIDR